MSEKRSTQKGQTLTGETGSQPSLRHRPRSISLLPQPGGFEAAGLRQRGPYQLRHTFATEALAAGVSIFELSRVMGASVRMIDRHYGHLARDSEQAIRARLNVKRHRSGVLVATGEEE